MVIFLWFLYLATAFHSPSGLITQERKLCLLQLTINLQSLQGMLEVAP